MAPLIEDQKILIGVSSCLLGERVRFDGGHKHYSYITSTLGEYFDFHPFCPEMAIGLGVPRETIHLIAKENDNGEEIVRCVGTKNPDKDVTDDLVETADKQKHWQASLSGYILKKDSPSCGMERVKLYRQFVTKKGEDHLQPEKRGVGVYAQRLMENFPNLPVEEEGRLGDAVLRENFIERVFIYHRWQQQVAQGITAKTLFDFHGRHKLNLFSRDQNKARELGGWLAKELSHKEEAERLPIAEVADEYVRQLMAILKIRANRKNHVNTLMHIQGYLKRDLGKEDKQELVEAIEDYRRGYTPLIVPITLLKHHFRRFPDPYIDHSYYMNPHPKELMLRNNL